MAERLPEVASLSLPLDLALMRLSRGLDVSGLRYLVYGVRRRRC